MFCSFAISPRIMRFFCTGKVVEWDEAAFLPLLQRMGKEKIEGARAVILLDVFKVRLSLPLFLYPYSVADENGHGEVTRVRCNHPAVSASLTSVPPHFLLPPRVQQTEMGRARRSVNRSSKIARRWVIGRQGRSKKVRWRNTRRSGMRIAWMD